MYQNEHIQKIIQLTQNSPKNELTFKIGGATKKIINGWLEELEKQGLTGQTIKLSSGDLGLKITKTSIEIKEIEPLNEELSFTDTESTAIHEVIWKDQVLSVQFQKGKKVYEYYNVPKEVFYNFKDAQSKGRFFQAEIRNNYSEKQA